jgi:hypothetical protein
MNTRRNNGGGGSRKRKEELLQIRLEVLEKQAFEDAASLAGLALSAWVRERLRLSARRELEESGRTVAFLPSLEDIVKEASDESS